MRANISIVTLCLCGGAAFVCPTSSDALTVTGAYRSDQDIVVTSTPAKPLQFRASVAITADELFISQPGGGSADVYVLDPLGPGGWQVEQRVSDEQPLIDAGAYLPCNGTAIDEATAAVGVANANGSRGKVVIYARSGASWSPQQTLTDSTGAAFDSFGCSVGLSGDTLVVGAPGKDLSGLGYVFQRSGTTWTMAARLLPADNSSEDQIGLSAAIDGGTILLGAPKKNSDTGAAYVFTQSRRTWSQTAKLVAVDGAMGDQFGATVSLSGDNALIGAPEHKGGEGEAYLFSRTGAAWSPQQRLQSNIPIVAGYFGSAVAISANKLIFGELGNSAAHLYRLIDNKWRFRAVAGEGSMTHFGGAVAVNGSYALIGAYSDGGLFGEAFVLKDDTIFADGY